MFDTLPAATTDDLSAGDVLRAVRDEQAAAQRAEARLLALAYQWAVMHPALVPGTEASLDAGPGVDLEPISGLGCPEVTEFSVAELGAALSMSTGAAKRLVGHSIELVHRLPRLWEQVRSGRVPAWRARAVAEVTIHSRPRLTTAAAAWVDAQVAAVAGKVGPAQLDRTVAEAVKRHELAAPDEFATGADDDPAPDLRHVTVDTDQVHWSGTMRVEADLDVADALDLAHAVREGAADLKALGSDATLDARRAMALGALARAQTSLRLGGPDAVSADAPASCTSPTSADTTSLTDGRPAPARPAARRLDLHVHLSASALGPGGLTLDGTARLEEGQRLVLLEHVRDWCRDSGTEVRILPVVDLAEPLSTDAYAPTPRLRRQVVLRERTCVFPWCARPARACDLDHVEPWAPREPDDHGPPSTRSDNLAPLCRRHHRLKTHTSWTYAPDPDHPPGTGHWVWRSPHGHQYRRDPVGSSPA